MSPVLEVKNLQTWYGESHILHGVNLTVNRGETVTILGRNGMGKTTTLRSIMGVARKRTGEIRFKGEDLLRTPLHKTARLGLGFVPEERGIFATLTVTENLMLPPKVAEGGMSLEEIYALFPNLSERRKSPGGRLSGGEQQMLAIARILRTGADVILLDEPTEGLAPVIVQKIGEALTALRARGLTIVLVEQNFRFAAKVSDRFYVMDHGKVALGFAASELAARKDELQDMLGV